MKEVKKKLKQEISEAFAKKNVTSQKIRDLVDKHLSTVEFARADDYPQLRGMFFELSNKSKQQECIIEYLEKRLEKKGIL